LRFVPLRRPRRIFRSSPPGSKQGLPHLGLVVAAFGFLALAALVTASAVFPSASRNSRSGDIRMADRVEAAATEISVVDGSTLRLAELVVRLEGIEAPGRGRTCHFPNPVAAKDSGAAKDCGAASTAALAALVNERRVACEVRDIDARGRPLAICTAAGQELNHALVAAGWARVSAAPGRDASRTAELKGAELSARTLHLGLWSQNPGSADVWNDENGATW
jgi:endonuclease YncB( thermonuclease family)